MDFFPSYLLHPDDDHKIVNRLNKSAFDGIIPYVTFQRLFYVPPMHVDVA
jgi:hypothetical protein